MNQASMKQPPRLPDSSNTQPRPASRHQRIRSGLIDHFMDSTVWAWLFLTAVWTALHLQASIDARAFLVILCSNFSTSMSFIALFFVSDFLLCISRGQSLGQMINGIYKTTQPTHTKNQAFDVLKLWLHSLVSRCLGLPLLLICLFIWLAVNPVITPIHLQDFSLIEPEGSYLLMIFLLKIIGITLLLFGLFAPFGLAFAQGALPTWYDQILGIHVMQKKPD
ncbi:MAG: hypothetical protein KGO49_00060 [Gammaproteobacteria bacterium]|nr:hypothetical protein [Gammaproteobacteria bacterium]